MNLNIVEKFIYISNSIQNMTFITQSKIFQAFISFTFDDYGLELIHPAIHIRLSGGGSQWQHTLGRSMHTEKYVLVYALNTWLGLLLQELLQLRCY